MDRTYTTAEAGKILNCNPTSIINWIGQGKLNCYRTPGGHRRIQHTDLVNFATKYNMPANFQPTLNLQVVA